MPLSTYALPICLPISYMPGLYMPTYVCTERGHKASLPNSNDLWVVHVV